MNTDPTTTENGLARRAYGHLRNLIRFDPAEQLRLLRHLLRWMTLGAASGVAAGVASATFLKTLDWATRAREAHPWVLLGLPFAGFVVGALYHFGGGRAVGGNNLIIDEIHDPRDWVPRRMAPLVFAGTVVTHVFGGSAGREGTAIQMSGSLSDGLARLVRLNTDDRRLMLIAAIAGGFGSVFGVPIAGFVFALEVQAVGRARYDAIVPALTASIVGDLVVRGIGVHHTKVPPIATLDLSSGLVLKAAVAGLVFGLAALVFAELVYGIKQLFADLIVWPPLRPVIGGLIVVGLVAVVGSRDYLGLSIPLATRALAGGTGVAGGAFALKLLFTAVTLGSGFQGGEVTPLFIIGATLGASLAHPLGVPVPLLASIGFVAVFAGATNTPLACTIMGVELFGSAAIVPIAVACVASYIATGERSIYASQRVDHAKAFSGDVLVESVTLQHVSERRRTWLPAWRRHDPS